MTEECFNGFHQKFDEYGNIELEYYYVGAEFHHDSKPAFVSYRNGKRVKECYYKHGVLHREKYPSEIWYDDNGKIIYIGYHNNGIMYSSEGFFTLSTLDAFHQSNQTMIWYDIIGVAEIDFSVF